VRNSQDRWKFPLYWEYKKVLGNLSISAKAALIAATFEHVFVNPWWPRGSAQKGAEIMHTDIERMQLIIILALLIRLLQLLS
jgi:hypothetical protein